MPELISTRCVLAVREAAELGNHSWFAYATVRGVDGLFAELRARGALINSEPRSEPWGMREFGVRTPDGHRITFGEPIGAS